MYVHIYKIIHRTILQWKKKHIFYYWNLEIWFFIISSLSSFCILAKFSGKLGITGTGSVVLEATHLIVSCTIYFRKELSFLVLTGFDDHVFEKPTLYFFSLVFDLTCSKRLRLLKSKTAKMKKMLRFWSPFAIKCMINLAKNALSVSNRLIQFLM